MFQTPCGDNTFKLDQINLILSELYISFRLLAETALSNFAMYNIAGVNTYGFQTPCGDNTFKQTDFIKPLALQKNASFRLLAETTLSNLFMKRLQNNKRQKLNMKKFQTPCGDNTFKRG